MEETPKSPSTMKQVLVFLLKGLTGIAGLAFLFSPLSSWTGIIVFFLSIIVAVICGCALMNIDESFAQKYGSSGYWPSKPIDWGPPRNESETREK